MRISHSKTELYSLCPAKYAFQYVDGLSADKTYTPLLFGSAIDKALNYVLTRTKRNHVVYPETALAIFQKTMNKWQGQNELIYFKNEMPPVIKEEASPEELQWAVWDNLCDIGAQMLETYQYQILPLFEKIISVQTKKIIPNDDGDELILITDFTAQLKDGRIVTFDNKTAGDVKKSYPKTAVSKSQQLAIYTEFEDTKLAGYIALQKKLVDNEIFWSMIVDEVPEEQVEKAFEKVDAALKGIKAEEFPTNQKACFSFGRKCEYWNLCKKGDSSGLIKKERKK